LDLAPDLGREFLAGSGIARLTQVVVAIPGSQPERRCGGHSVRRLAHDRTEGNVQSTIMPMSNFSQAVKFSDMCGASVPAWMGRLFDGTENDPETRRMVGMVVVAEQVRLLQANGVDEFHFYTLNRPYFDVCHSACARGAGGGERLIRGDAMSGIIKSL
jgi:hypothetical protein